MARGNEIVVTADPKGTFMEGWVGAGLTVKPGSLMQVDNSIALKGGRFTYKYQTPGSDGSRPVGALLIALANNLIGKLTSDTYAAGDRIFLYCPVAGEEVNVLLADVAGTGDDHVMGEQLILQNATGKLIAKTGSPGAIPFLLNESVTDPVADTLVWCQYSGY